jgi:hypothetical protein
MRINFVRYVAEQRVKDAVGSLDGGLEEVGSKRGMEKGIVSRLQRHKCRGESKSSGA